jgi:hypothetical protein
MRAGDAPRPPVFGDNIWERERGSFAELESKRRCPGGGYRKTRAIQEKLDQAREGEGLFQNKQDGKNQGGKNKTTQSKINELISGNGHNAPHFIAIISVATAEIKAARAAIRPETANSHVVVFSGFSLFLGRRGSFFLAMFNNNTWGLSGQPRRSLSVCAVYRYVGSAGRKERWGTAAP